MESNEPKYGEGESKVVYTAEGGLTRVVRGIVSESGSWVIVTRKTGVIRIPRERVLSIKEPSLDIPRRALEEIDRTGGR